MRSVVVVVALAVVAGAGLAGAYLWLWQPRARDKERKAEVAELAAGWAPLRRCLVGDEPASSDPFEAMMFRELTEPELPAALAECEPLLRRVRRPPGAHSGSEEVEARWLALREARRELGKALALRLADTPLRPPAVLRRRLAEAARGAERAYADLREAVAMEPDPVAGSPLPRLAAKPIAGEGAEVAHFETESNRVLAVVPEGAARALFVAGPGGARRELVPGPATPAVGEGWAAWIEPPVEEAPAAVRVLAGELEDGALPRPALVARLAGDVSAAVLGALGDDRGRRVVAVLERPQWRLRLFRSSDRGATWSEDRSLEAELEGAPFQPRVELFPLAGRLVVSAGGKLIELSRADLAAAAVHPFSGTSCFGPRRSWWNTMPGVMTAVPGEPASPVAGSEELPWSVTACSDAQLLGVGPAADRPDRQSVRICSPTGCELSATVPLPAAARVQAAIGAIGGPMIAFESDGVIVIWSVSEDAKGLRPRASGRLAEGAALAGLLEWDGELRAVLDTGESVAVAPLP